GDKAWGQPPRPRSSEDVGAAPMPCPRSLSQTLMPPFAERATSEGGTKYTRVPPEAPPNASMVCHIVFDNKKCMRETMSLRINDEAPDFTAETTQGTIRFHEWIGDGWAILFSHPKDFTPVCTTELGYMAGLQPEFAKRNTKVLGLSVDPVTSHG